MEKQFNIARYDVNIGIAEFWSVNHSVMSDSLQPYGLDPQGSSLHGILQARMLEWVVIPFSRGFTWPRDSTQVSCIAGRSFTIWANFPKGTVIKKPHANAEDMGSILLWEDSTLTGETACVLQLLKLIHLRPVLCNKRTHHNEKPVHHKQKVAPNLPWLEKAHTQQQRPSETNKKNK